MKISDINASPLAVGLVLAGAILAGAGLFMMVPLHFDKSWHWSNLPLVGMLVVIGAFICIAPNAAHEAVLSFKTTILVTSKMYTMLILLFIVMGTSGVVGRLYQAQIERVFSLHPLTIGVLGGFTIPSPTAVTPLMERLWQNPAFQVGIMYFAQVNGILSISLFHLRVGGFSPGSPIPTKIYTTSLAMSVFMLFLIKPAMIFGDWMLMMWKR